MNIPWGKTTKENFEKMISKIPIFLREIAREKVSEKADNLASEAGRPEIIEKDLVDAFFAETPFGFHGPMKTDMEEFGIDYTKYGYEEKGGWGFPIKKGNQ